MVLTGKPFVFAAGADIDEFPKLRTREEAIAGSRAGHELFGRIRALPFPTVAAINGACLGGGARDRAALLGAHDRRRRCGTSAARRSSSGSSPPGAGRSCPAARRRGERDPRHRPEPAAAEQAARRARRRSSSASRTGCSSPVEFVDESIAFALELVESPLERAEPDHGDVEKTFRKRALAGRRRRSRRRAGAVPRARPDRARVHAARRSRRATAPRRRRSPT